MSHGLLGWIVVGLIAGWLSGKITRGAGFGLLGDLFLGLVGGVIGGWIFRQLGHLCVWLHRKLGGRSRGRRSPGCDWPPAA